MSVRTVIHALAFALVTASATGTALAQTLRTDVPGFVVRFLGAGTPVAINSNNQVAGFRDVNAVRHAVIFEGGTVQDLPMLSGSGSCEASDINDLGTVVGFCAANLYATGRAVVWTRTGSTYSVAEIPTFAGDTGSSAAAINNSGEIVGVHNYRLVTGLQVGAGFVWRAGSVPVDLLQTYGMNDFPVDINDAGQVVAGQKRLDLTTGGITDLGVPPGPPAYFASRIAAISANGTVAATGVPASSSGPQRHIRHRNGAWLVLGGWGQYDAAAGVNDAGTVVGRGVAYLGSGGSAIQATAWFDQIGALLYVNDFLVEPARDWIVLSATDVNGDGTGGGGVAGVGRIVGIGTNLVTNQYGAVIVEPSGALPAPHAPSALQATPWEATWQRPFNSIQLGWTDNSRTDWGFRVERSLAGQETWSELARVSGPTYEDTTGTPGTAYDYRVKAIGLAGDSAPSASSRATFPSTVVDTTPPTATFVAPVDGAQVSGLVAIVVDTSDNVGVSYVTVEYQPNAGLPQICSGVGGGLPTFRLTCSWNTQSLAPGTYLLTASVSDAMGNGSIRSISVQVGGTAAASSRVSSVSLAATSLRRGVATVTGRVSVVDQAGAPLRSAGVWVAWETPAGARSAFAYTDRRGIATVSVSGGRGSYRLTVTDVSAAGYPFDRAGSSLSGSIVVQ